MKKQYRFNFNENEFSSKDLSDERLKEAINRQLNYGWEFVKIDRDKNGQRILVFNWLKEDKPTVDPFSNSVNSTYLEECKVSKKCFLICPIGEEGSDIRKRSDKVMKYLLNPICNQKGYEVIRSDLITSVNRISSDIINHLENDELAIADLTGRNPNVFYEIGYRKAKGMPTIHIAEKGTELPFDTIDDRAIFFDITDIESAEKFKDLLSKTIDKIPPINKTPKSNNGDRMVEKKEKPYISFLREIVNEFNSNGRTPITYSLNSIDRNDLDILSAKEYVYSTIFGNNLVSITPTGLGLERILYNS